MSSFTDDEYKDHLVDLQQSLRERSKQFETPVAKTSTEWDNEATILTIDHFQVVDIKRKYEPHYTREAVRGMKMRSGHEQDSVLPLNTAPAETPLNDAATRRALLFRAGELLNRDQMHFPRGGLERLRRWQDGQLSGNSANAEEAAENRAEKASSRYLDMQ